MQGAVPGLDESRHRLLIGEVEVTNPHSAAVGRSANGLRGALTRRGVANRKRHVGTR